MGTRYLRGRAGVVHVSIAATTAGRCTHKERIAERYEKEILEPPPPVPVPGSVLDRWITEGKRFDEIVQDPYVFGRFMDDLMCRIAVDHLLVDHRYQHAVNQLIVTFFMIGRMTKGAYQLPVVVDDNGT